MEACCQNLEDAAALLRRHRIALTHQRLEIALAIFARRQHLSAEQVLARVLARQANVSKATVYNTLRLFRDCGLVAEVVVDPARIFYDPETTPHYHLYDADTGTLTDIRADGVRIEGLPPLPEGMTAERLDLVVRARRARVVA